MEGLKPCPFCGGKAAVVQNATTTYFLDYRVRCKRCGAETGMYTTAIKAVRCWNNRSACDDCQMGGVPATEKNMAKYGWVKERTCRNTHKNRWFSCSECGFGFMDMFACDEHDIEEQPRYCPNCGAKVVNE